MFRFLMRHSRNRTTPPFQASTTTRNREISDFRPSCRHAGKPRPAGLRGREVGACDHLSLSCTKIEPGFGAENCLKTGVKRPCLSGRCPCPASAKESHTGPTGASQGQLRALRVPGLPVFVIVRKALDVVGVAGLLPESVAVFSVAELPADESPVLKGPQGIPGGAFGAAALPGDGPHRGKADPPAPGAGDQVAVHREGDRPELLFEDAGVHLVEAVVLIHVFPPLCHSVFVAMGLFLLCISPPEKRPLYFLSR